MPPSCANSNIMSCESKRRLLRNRRLMRTILIRRQTAPQHSRLVSSLVLSRRSSTICSSLSSRCTFATSIARRFTSQTACYCAASCCDVSPVSRPTSFGRRCSCRQLLHDSTNWCASNMSHATAIYCRAKLRSPQRSPHYPNRRQSPMPTSRRRRRIISGSFVQSMAT